MKINKLFLIYLLFTAFATFCIFEGSDLMLNIGATVLVILCTSLALKMIWDATRPLPLTDNVCPKCLDGILHPLRSLEVKMCGTCGHNVAWKLKDGQLPLVSNNRQIKRAKS